MQDKVASEAKLFHEDIEVGRPYDCGRRIVTKDEIVAFARQFDPQPMHLDEAAAKKTLVGGLCASGFHTCAMMMRMVCDGILNRVVSLGSPGVDEVRWVRPVRPGDALSARYLAREKRVLASRPDVGICKVLVELVDDEGEVVASWTTNQLTRVRNPGPAPAEPAPKREKQAISSLWELAVPAGPPLPDAYFEDRQIGEMAEFASHTFGKDEMIAFAREYDPQPFHLDEAAAKASLFGGLCASGWHTRRSSSAAWSRRACRPTPQRLPGASASPSTAPRRASASCSGRSRCSSATPSPFARACPRRSTSSRAPTAAS